MKNNVIKAIFWALSIMIGFIIVDVIKDNSISFLHAIIAGIVAGIVDFIFSLISDKRKKKNSK